MWPVLSLYAPVFFVKINRYYYVLDAPGVSVTNYLVGARLYKLRDTSAARVLIFL